MSDFVLAATRWPSNAELIADCARLGYLKAEWSTLDPTYGRGIWWKLWQPDELTGLELVDRLEHVRRPGPQSQTSQLHARRNLSTLFVMRKTIDIAARDRQGVLL